MSGSLQDTLMNVQIFLFIGLLVWLYFKETDDNDG